MSTKLNRTAAKAAVEGTQFIDLLPKPVAILMAEGVRTFGAATATRLLQRAAGLPMDGALTEHQAETIAKEAASDTVARLLTEWALYRMGSRYFDEKGRVWLIGMFKVAQEVAHGH